MATIFMKGFDTLKQISLAVMWLFLVATVILSSCHQTDGKAVTSTNLVSATTSASDMTTTTTTTTTATTSATTTITTAATTKTTKKATKATTAKTTKKVKDTKKTMTTKVKATTTTAATTATKAKVTTATKKTTTATTTLTAKKMVVKVDSSSHVNLRVCAGGRKKGELVNGDVVIVTALTTYKSREWVQVTVEKTGKEGWMWASFLEEPEAKTTASTTETAKKTKNTTTSKEIKKYWNDRDFGETNDGETFVENEIIFNSDFGETVKFDWEAYRLFGFENIEAMKVGQGDDFKIYYFEINENFEIKGEITLEKDTTLWLEVRKSDWDLVKTGTYRFYPAERSLLRG